MYSIVYNLYHFMSSSLLYDLNSFPQYKAFHHFLAEEKLLSPNAPCFTTEEDHHRNILTDEEYLGGACIGLCHDLSKYGVTRASNAVDDAAAVPFIKFVPNTTLT